MPETYRATVSIPGASLLPRDRVVHSMHFRHSIGALLGTDLTSFADNILDAFTSAWLGATPARLMECRIYRTEGPPPHDPQVTRVRNAASEVVNGNWPNEIALCLSFKGGSQPHQRGRIYLAPWMPGTYSGLGAIAMRPPTGMQDLALSLGQALADAGGADWSWVVRSRVRGTDTTVASCWVDDEWDTQRRRGTRPTARRTRTTGS